MSRLFIGIYPPAPVVDLIRALPRPEMAGVRWVPEHQWHITLRFFGNADEDEARRAFDAMELATTATVEIGPHVSRLRRAVVCLPAHGLDDLASLVVRATAHVGEPADPRPFTGHLTIGRLRGRGACGVAGERFAAAFPVQEVALVRSTLSSSGAEHETVATRPMG